MKKIIYIHGYLSGGNSATGTLLKSQCNNVDVITPEVNGDPVASLAVINKCIEQTKPSLIIGSSMGGLYALASDSGNTPLCLINPLLIPEAAIREHFLNKTFAYHSPRVDGATESTITDKELSEFAAIEAKIPELIEAKKAYITAILSVNDELLGDSHIKALTGRINRIFTADDFGHRCGGSAITQLLKIIQSV